MKNISVLIHDTIYDTTGTGRPVFPIKARSISLAACLPSVIAQTTKDCPRRQSMQNKNI